MVRNVVLAISSLAVLVVLLVAYTMLLGRPAGSRPQPALAQLPSPADPNGEQIHVGPDVEVPAGGKIIFVRYDERTGQPTDRFACQDWKPVPGSQTEIRVSGPELDMRLPSGLVATVLGDEGQLAGDRVEKSQMRPRSGWLTGNVRIIIDRNTSTQRGPRDDRPEDLITIRMERIEFDLERGELRTEDRVEVDSEDFEVTGTGLNLVWNQPENRVENLTITHGEEFVLYTVGGLLSSAGVEEPDTGHRPGPQPGESSVPRKKGRPERVTSYLCTLQGGVEAAQYGTDEAGQERQVGGLKADEVRLLFDMGGAAGRALGSRTTSAPTSRESREHTGRLVVKWQGGLELVPAEPATRPTRRRMQFVAVGSAASPLMLSRGEGSVRCGKLEYHDETQRVWVEPLPGERVDFGLGQNMTASATGVYIDRGQRVVKLAGAVELRSARGQGERQRQSSIHCDLWAELKLAADAVTSQPAMDALGSFEELESATFVGNVGVDLGQQKLTGHQLAVTFRPPPPGDKSDGGVGLEESLDTATAWGQVLLTSGDGALKAEQVALTFGLTESRDVYPQHMDAVGTVELSRQRSRVRGQRVVADLRPPEASSPTGSPSGPQFALRSLEILDRAELVDPQNKVAARGEQISAAFGPANRLDTATVRGTADQPGMVHARPYTVRGEQIELDRDAQTLKVAGPSRLAFKTRRSLQGQERGEATAVVVSSTDRMEIDGRANQVRFEGAVSAISGEEQLQGDTMTLLLEDVAEPASARRESWQDLWRQLRGTAGKPASAEEDAFVLRLDEGDERGRKEPVRLVAENALVSSQSFAAGDEQPVVDASISAPLLEVDIVHRQIVTTGTTQLLMVDRRGVAEEGSVKAALGLPSALLSRGPSQTAMQCSKRMTYALGPDGPGRRDTAVFEGDVLFVHRTGKEMANWAEVLPEVAARPEDAGKLRSRSTTLDCQRLECWFAADEGTAPAERGGALTRTPLRLASLMASDGVYLRDQQESRIREVHAAWVEFDRSQGLVHVRGSDVAQARVYFEDVETKQSDVHAGADLVIDLLNGTIRTDEIHGEVRRAGKP